MTADPPLPPSGTVTFLFTDVEGSSELWAAGAEEMAASLRLHDEVVRSVVEPHGGYVFTTAGDSFSVAFDRASVALVAAEELQAQLSAARWPGPALRVRVGLHLGEAEERGGDYFGPAVNIAARVEAAGHGGQVLLTDAVRAAVSVDAMSLGRHRLRGVGEVEIFQLGAGEFPALRAEDVTTAGNLPRPVGELVGRTGAVSEAVALARRGGLLTIVGPGGMGKTRLAIEVGMDLAADCVDGGWFVDLASASSTEAVVHLAIEALGVRATEGEGLHSAVVRHLADRSAVVVLDNCEHVLDGAAELASAVSAGAAGVTLLATSRERLDIDGEQLLPLEGLPVEGAAVELFVERARAIDPRFEPSNLEIVAELCAQLDGMPLAIELAAARVGSMTPEELLTHLGDRFRLLRSGRRGRGGRGAATLRETVGWSYRMMEPEAQLVMSRLSVFPASFNVDDTVAVCTGDELDRLDLVELISELVDKSLLVADGSGPVTRYRMLETIRAFGREILEETGTRDRVQLAFATHVADWLANVLTELEGAGDLQAAAELDRGWADLREAVEWALSVDDVDLVVELAAGLGYEAQLRERREAREWLWRAADLDGAHDHARAAELLASAAIMDWTAGDYNSSHRRWQEIEAIRSERGEPITVQVALVGAQSSGAFRGDRDSAHRTLENLLPEARATENLFCQAQLLMTLGILSAYDGESERGAAYLDELTALAERLDNSYMQVGAAVVSTMFSVDANSAGAVQAARSAIEMAEQARLQWWSNMLTNYLIWGLLLAGRDDEAVEPLRDGLDEMSRGAAINSLAVSARALVVLLEHQLRFRAAATIAGWLDAQNAGHPGTPSIRRAADEAVEALLSHLKAEDYDAAISLGAQLTAEQLIELALNELDYFDTIQRP